MIVFGNKVSGKDAVKGLMYIKKPLWNNNGMLFNMDDHPKNHSMWMKNTYIPLDIIFLDENMKIVGFKENNQPHSLKQMRINKPSRYVLEMNAGSVKDNNLKINDKLFFMNIKYLIIFLLIFFVFFYYIYK